MINMNTAFLYRSIRKFSSYYTLRSNSIPKLTFFTKSSCSLCHDARKVLDKAIDESGRNELDLKIVDIMSPDNTKWYDVYCFDVPVLHIDYPDQKKPIKFMHRFQKEQILEHITKSQNAE